MIFNSSGSGASIKRIAISSADDLPTTAPNGTIAVITTTAFNKWLVANVEPTDPSSGDIWMSIFEQGDSRSLDLKGDGSIILSPATVRQYEDSAWVVKSYYLRKDDEWLSNELILLDGGVDKTTSGWSTSGTAPTKNTDNWAILNTFSGTITTKDSFANSYEKLNIDGYATAAATGFGEYSMFRLLDSSGNTIKEVLLPTSRATTSIDVSNYKGQNVKVQWSVYGSTSYGVSESGYAYKIWFS